MVKINRKVGGSNPPIPTNLSGCSSVWLERVIWDHEAASSSLATRTSLNEARYR